MIKSHIPSCQPNLPENCSGFLKLGKEPHYDKVSFEMTLRLIGSASPKKISTTVPNCQADAVGTESITSGVFNVDSLLKSEKDVVQYSQDSFGEPSQNQSSIHEFETPKMVPSKRNKPETNQGEDDIHSGWFTPKQA